MGSRAQLLDIWDIETGDEMLEVALLNSGTKTIDIHKLMKILSGTCLFSQFLI
jgi:hypothetical protein